MKRIIIIFSFYFLAACGDKQVEFEQSKWSENIDGFYKFREVMVKDLMEKHLKRGMTYKQITDLIGKPEIYSNLKTNIIGYTLMEDYGWNIDPIETKTLLIELTTDSLIQNLKVEHWRK